MRRYPELLTPLVCRVIHFHYTMPLDLIQCSAGSKGGGVHVPLGVQILSISCSF